MGAWTPSLHSSCSIGILTHLQSMMVLSFCHMGFTTVPLVLSEPSRGKAGGLCLGEVHSPLADYTRMPVSQAITIEYPCLSNPKDFSGSSRPSGGSTPYIFLRSSPDMDETKCFLQRPVWRSCHYRQSAPSKNRLNYPHRSRKGSLHSRVLC